MNFYDWQNKGSNAAIAMDAARELPPGETLEEHRKKCKAVKGLCPYEEKADNADVVFPAKNGQSGYIGELADIYEREGVSENLVNAAERYHEDILSGKVKPPRIPASVFQNKEVGKIPNWMTFAYLVGSNYMDEPEKAGEVLESFAKAAESWIDGDMNEKFIQEHGKKIGSGLEANVYDSGDKVVKASTLDCGSRNALSQIERLMLGNIYFPETGYTPFGMGRDSDGNLLYALEQNKVKLSDEDPLTEDELKAWLKERGWTMKDEWLHNCASKGDDLACLDMHNGNVVKTVDGNIICIDACVIPNTYSLGMHGPYNYEEPPNEFDDWTNEQ